jgi:hypothetical protein
MNIKSAKYVAIDGENAGITAVIGDTTWHIPLVEDNAQYQKVLEWAEEDGNTIQEAD